MSTVIARTAVRASTPLILLTAIASLIGGHNRPGGGFVAAVLVAAAVTLVYVVYGRSAVERVLHVGPRGYWRLAGGGLAIAFAGGLVPVALGQPFLTQAVLFAPTPLGEVELASALVFDVGVLVSVVGALLAIVAALGREGR